MSVWGDYTAVPDWTLREKEILAHIRTLGRTHCPVLLMHRTRWACFYMARKLRLPLLQRRTNRSREETEILVSLMRRRIRDGFTARQIRAEVGLDRHQFTQLRKQHGIRSPRPYTGVIRTTEDGYSCGIATLDAIRSRARARHVAMRELAVLIGVDKHALVGRKAPTRFRLTGTRLRTMVDYLDGRITRTPDGGIALVWND